MNTTIHLHGKPVRVELSAAAERALVRRSEPLFAEVQLIFGCMIAKRVWFRDEAVENAVPVNSKLSVWFRPARYEKACSFDDIDNGAEASDYPLAVDRRRFVPDLLFIDYRNGKFAGDFTYSMDLYREQNPALESPK
ncbi:MAG: hypothetical protein HY082_01265 [Gammaproteobacteria bacterium]|nr:hypothetical protein [Gammaproteobacteria bacterium]